MTIKHDIVAPIIDTIIRPITSEFFYSIANDPPPAAGDFLALDFDALDFKVV